MLHIALAGGAILRLLRKSQNVGERCVELIQGVAVARAHVEDAAGCDFFRSSASQQICIHRVLHKGEVAAGRTVSVDGWRFAGHHLVDELRNHAGVGRIGRLPWAEDVEVAQAYAFHAIHIAEGLDVVLARQLLDGVGRERLGQHLFVLRLRGLVAIRGRRGGVDDALHARIASSQQHI
jgi:hypothetical protein